MKNYRARKEIGFENGIIYVWRKGYSSWKKQFDIAKQLHVKFVTGEPRWICGTASIVSQVYMESNSLFIITGKA